MPGGRPLKLTDETHRVIVEAIAAGVPRKFAALRAGVSENALARWLAKGRKAKSGVFFNLVNAIKKAEADAVARNVARVQKAGEDPKTWQAAAWWLERRHPKEFGKKERSELGELLRRLVGLEKMAREAGNRNPKD